MSYLSDRIINLNTNLKYQGNLPKRVQIMNPFQNSPYAIQISSSFYKKYYHDNNPRKLILGINPGRLGAGITGIPFTDTKQLESKCKIEFKEAHSHEPSSVFIYDLITQMGGPQNFYKSYYISSVCPLGFTIQKDNGKAVNYNYYDSKELTEYVLDFIVENIRLQIELGMETEKCFVLGNNKNYNFVTKLNKKYNFFEEVIPLAHPRYVMQYKLLSKQDFINDYISKLTS